MINAQNQNQTIVGPSLTDRDLRVELVARDFDFPTSIEFLGKDDFLLLEKNTGDIYRILNGNVTGPLIHIDVSQKDERGLLGIAILENDNLNKDKDNAFVFLYYTLCTKITINIILEIVEIMYTDIDSKQRIIHLQILN